MALTKQDMCLLSQIMSTERDRIQNDDSFTNWQKTRACDAINALAAKMGVTLEADE
jgi:hypothetical protein